jgi:uncharacterized protein YoxC
MFDSSILDMVILLFFTYFICSVLLSVLVEMGATLLKFRANELEKTLKSLFFDTGWNNYVTDTILKSSFFTVLKKDENGKGPSYVPAENFAKAIFESLRSGTNPLTTEAIRKNIATLPVGLQNIVLGYLDTANDNIEHLQKQLEGFYNNAMDRAGGWYKKKIKTISLIIAALLVIALNIDTIEIIQKSTKKPKELELAVNSIQEKYSNFDFIRDSTGNITEVTIKNNKVQQSVPTKNPNSEVEKKLAEQYNSFQSLKGELNNNVYSIGYKEVGFAKAWFGEDESDWSNFFLKIFGMFLTVLALQVGSSFWFDSLNKVINLRGTGKKPVEKPKNS